MIARAKRVWPNNHPGKYADNLKKCSCWMCGNLRKQEGMTMQERRFYCEA